VLWGKVSATGARDDYGVVIVDGPRVDQPASDELRTAMRAERAGEQATSDEPFFDRGPGYRLLSGGRPYADLDLL
jgi:N-methylhydantoinase B